MKSKVSELMDGELGAEDAADLITNLKKQAHMQGNWETYHLIGDSLRQSTNLSIDISQNLNRALEDEPVVLAPYVPKPFKRRMVAVSIAASVIVMVAGWLSLQNMNQQPQQTLMAEESGLEHTLPMIPVSNTVSSHGYPLAPAEINDYLFVHGEFSPGTATRGLTNYYVHPVTNSQEAYRR